MFRVIAIAFFTFILIGYTALACSECSFSMGWEEWPPYQFKTFDGYQPTGLDIEILRAVTEDLGCSLTLENVPWKRHLLFIKEGSIDLAAAASKIPEREIFAFYSEPYRTETVRLFIRKGEAIKYPFRSLIDLKKYPFQLGITRGYYYGRPFDELIQDNHLKNSIQIVILV